MFLFLSGYGLEESFKAKGLNGYWKRKGVRLITPYLLWILLFFITSKVLSISSPFFLRYWYLEYLLLWYLIFWLIKLIPALHGKGNSIMLLISIVLFFSMSNIRAEQSLSFLAGVILSDNIEKIKNLGKRKIGYYSLLWFAMGITFLAVKQLPVVRSYDVDSILMKFVQLGIKLPLGLFFVCSTYAIYKEIITTRFFTNVGIVSLELYLVQMQFYHLIEGSFKNLIIVSIWVVGLSLLLHYLSKMFIVKIEKSPLYNHI